MSKKIWKPVSWLSAMALVFSLAAIALAFALPSLASAQGDGMVCQTSVANHTGNGANTTHNFTVPAGATGGYVLVEFTGDFEDWSYDWNWDNDEFIEVYIDGDYIGRDRGQTWDCEEALAAATWPLGAAQMSGWAADGTISVTVVNSMEVDFCYCSGCDQHRVTLCYTTAPLICEESLIDYTGDGASTIHNFSVPMGAAALAYVVVEFRGDFGEWTPYWNPANDEFIEVYVDGDYIGRDQGHWDDCSENWTAATWALGAEQMSDWAADGTISVRVANSEEVEDGCSPDQHRVTLCYTPTVPVNCEQSLISYNGSGANTTHNFSVPPGATNGYVLVEFRGDFGDWTANWTWTEDGDEFIEVYIEGDYIGRDHTDFDDCDGNWTAAIWTLGAAQMSGWAADGTVSVVVQNSPAVDDFCPREHGTYNQHRVTLCYTEPEAPPVGGEAYPVSRIPILVPWIAVGVVLAGGIAWYVLRRRRT
jgi:hypothetical protein